MLKLQGLPIVLDKAEAYSFEGLLELLRLGYCEPHIGGAIVGNSPVDCTSTLDIVWNKSVAIRYLARVASEETMFCSLEPVLQFTSIHHIELEYPSTGQDQFFPAVIAWAFEQMVKNSAV
jgi:hypothetical protein